MSISNIRRTQVFLLLNTVADELEARFGPHPTVSKAVAKEVAAEIVNKTTFNDKAGLIDEIGKQIDKRYQVSGLPE